jgi:hypothetical protein
MAFYTYRSSWPVLKLLGEVLWLDENRLYLGNPIDLGPHCNEPGFVEMTGALNDWLDVARDMPRAIDGARPDMARMTSACCQTCESSQFPITRTSLILIGMARRTRAQAAVQKGFHHRF